MGIKEKTKDSLIRDLEKQSYELKWDINKRGLEIAKLTEQQKIQKRKRQLLSETIKYIKEQ